VPLLVKSAPVFPKISRIVAELNNMKNKDLSFKMEKTAFYIVSGLSFVDIAAKVGTSSRSIFRWLKLPEMQSRIRELRRITIEHSTNDLLRLNKKAVQTLEKLLDCESSPASRCRAASIILTKTTESLEYEYESRLKAIEAKFNETK
jgi:transposase-like protein